MLHATIGHSSDKMTEHYSHVGKEEKLAAVEQLFQKVKSEQNCPSRCPNDQEGGGATTHHTP